MEKLILKETFQQIISTTEVKEHNSKSFDLIIEDAFIGELNSSKNIIKVIVSSSFNKIIIEGQFYSQLNDSINKILQGQYKLIIIDIEE
ncbi:MAG: hypothetical protein DRP42_00030 [Tenericutes bacterium]|nr:MAG: hypothetical protein DRP42_00030 [Mycoplasmatota bacterium]